MRGESSSSGSGTVDRYHYAPAMTPPQRPQLVRRHASGQKAQLIYQLFLLENARNRVEEELRNFTNKAYVEVQGFLNSSFPTSVFGDLTKALDSRRRAIDRLSALLKDPVVEQHVCVQPAIQNGVRANHRQPLGHEGIPMTDVLKFGPMLQNVLVASSMAKAVQVLGATLSPQQLKHFLIPQPAVVQDDDIIHSTSSSHNNIAQTMCSSGRLKAAEKEQAVVSEEKSQPHPVIVPPAIIPSAEITAERPPIETMLPEITNPKPMKIPPVISWGREEGVQVQHRKQTSSQLLHFLRAKAENTGALEVTECGKSMYTPGLPQSPPPDVKTQSCRLGQAVTDGHIEAFAPNTSCANAESQAPVFRVKRVESSGSLTYTCVIATKTELWDVGDIPTEAQQRARSDGGPVTSGDHQNTTAGADGSRVNVQRKTQTLGCAGPEREGGAAVAIPEFQVQRFEEMEVVVSHIVSPGNFFIQHADSFAKLQALVTDSWKAGSSYAEQNCIPDIGTRVMGWFPKQEQWLRAQVTKIYGVCGDVEDAGSGPSIEVEVWWLDSGGTARLSLLNVRELTPEAAALPLQAVQVALANVTPANGSDWSEEAVGWFQAMVHNRTLYARLYPRGPKITVELFLEKGKLRAMRRGASLSLRLAQNGHAAHSKLKNVGRWKSGSLQPRMRKHDSAWEKRLVSCYARSKRPLWEQGTLGGS